MMGIRVHKAIVPQAPMWRVKTVINGSISRYISTKSPASLHNHTHTHSHSHNQSSTLRELRPPKQSHSHAEGHSHSHKATGELLSTGNFHNPAVRITLIGFVANVSMAVGKGIGGVLFHSQSLIADAIHAISDLLSDLVTLGTVSVSKRHPTARFPNGYGRIETIGALGVSSMLLFAGISMGCSSLSEILLALNIDLSSSFASLSSLIGHSHSHGIAHSPTTNTATQEVIPAEWSAAGVALASILVKESLYRITRKVAEQQNSPVLYANAWHHRVDSLVSVVAVMSISLGQLFQLAWVDPLGGLLVSGVIIKAGWGPSVDAVVELCGGVRLGQDSPALKEFDMRAHAELAAIAPTYSIEKLQLEPYGSTYVGSVQLKNVDQNAVAVAQNLKESLSKMENVRQVYVRI